MKLRTLPTVATFHGEGETVMSQNDEWGPTITGHEKSINAQKNKLEFVRRATTLIRRPMIPDQCPLHVTVSEACTGTNRSPQLLLRAATYNITALQNTNASRTLIDS